MSWSFKIGLVIAGIIILLAVGAVVYDTITDFTGKTTPAGGKKAFIPWILVYSAWTFGCYYLYQNDYRSLGATLLWLLTVPALLVTLIGLAIVIWGPLDFK